MPTTIQLPAHGPAAHARPEPPTWRWAWHGWANALVLGWLAVTVTVIALSAAGAAAVPEWLAVHAFLLGGVTTAIVVWSEHFAVAVLHAPPVDRRWSVARLAVLTTGQVATLYGAAGSNTAALAAGATLIAAAVAAHGWVLLRMRLRALGGRLAGIVDYYLAACAALLAAAALGGLLGTGFAAGPPWHERLHSAHAHLAVGGWVLLTVLGTLFMLWPTTLRTRMADGTQTALRWCLRLAAPGLATAAAGLLAGLRPVAVAGLAGYAAGVAVALVPLARTLGRVRPRNGPAWLLFGSVAWLLVAVVVDLLLVAGSPGSASAAANVLGPVLLVGVIGQVLLGSLSFLLPVVLGGGPAAVRAANARIDAYWPVRVGLLNAGVAGLAAAPILGSGRVAWLIVALVGAESLLRTASLVVPRLVLPRRWPPAAAGVALGVLVTTAAVLVAASGTAGEQGHDHAAGTGPARTVDVELTATRVRPATIDVAPGTRLRLRVTNRDSQPHDLRTATGARTPLLRNGHTATLDVGAVTRGVDVWCTVPGHRAGGMRLKVTVNGAPADAPAAAAGHAHGEPLDTAAAFTPGFRPHDASLPPARPGRVHRVELPVVERDIEVAPGVRQRMWTFGGTVPGPTLRGTVGDEFHVTLVNTGSLAHGVDFHAGAVAPDGVMRSIAPGERLVYRFRADKAGIWLYHCSTHPMTQHIAAGMFGAVVIDPPDLRPVDREYLLVASELYLGTPGSDGQVARLRAGTPDGWAFNGTAGQYDHAPLTARAGQRVRFWVLSAGPGSTTAFHVVGARFDTVYSEGGYLLRPTDPGGAQVLPLAAAQGGFTEAIFAEPGTYAVVDHDMRHAEAGAHGKVVVRP